MRFFAHINSRAFNFCDSADLTEIDGLLARGFIEVEKGFCFAEILPTLKEQAKAELDRTDIVAVRCIKAGVAYPASWQTYTAALRAIISGADTTSTVLPVQPTYPAGT